MRKLLGLFITFLFLNLSALASDIRFIQVDGAMYNKDTSKNFENLINKINTEKNVDFVIFTGNNLSSPNEDNLKSFIKNAKKLDCPYYFVLGNKDVKKQKLSKKEYFKILNKKVRAHKKITSPNYVFEKNKMIFIVLDGSKEVIPTSFGYYKADTLNWLEKQLTKYHDKNVVIIQHFPIIPPAEKENYYTFKADEYLELISKFKNVKAVVSGHFNTNKETKFGEILHISTTNAPKYRIIDILDCNSEQIEIWSVIKE